MSLETRLSSRLMIKLLKNSASIEWCNLGHGIETEQSKYMYVYMHCDVYVRIFHFKFASLQSELTKGALFTRQPLASCLCDTASPWPA